MQFNKIAVLENTRIPTKILDQLQEFSKEEVQFFSEDSSSDDETIKRIGDADCVLISWRIALTKNVLESCKQLKYICVCATTTAKIAVETAKKQGIIITNVHNYSDISTAEYVFAELLSFARGFENLQWKEKATDLAGKKLGIVGLGPVGKEVARIALGFNMEVLYTSRTRKQDYEDRGLQFRSLTDLVEEADIISLHTPNYLQVLTKQHFDLMKEKILVNTTLGKAFDERDFFTWIQSPGTFAIMDQCPDSCFAEKTKHLKNVRFRNCVAADTIDSQINLGNVAINNLKSVLQGNPKNAV